MKSMFLAILLFASSLSMADEPNNSTESGFWESENWENIDDDIAETWQSNHDDNTVKED